MTDICQLNPYRYFHCTSAQPINFEYREHYHIRTSLNSMQIKLIPFVKNRCLKGLFNVLIINITAYTMSRITDSYKNNFKVFLSKLAN